MPPWGNYGNGFVISIPLFRMAASEVRMIFKRCSLITFKRYDQTITMVASGGHVNSLNVGIKRAKNWLFGLWVCSFTRGNGKTKENMLSYPGSTLNAKKWHAFGRIPTTKSKSTHFPHTTGDYAKKNVHIQEITYGMSSYA